MPTVEPDTSTDEPTTAPGAATAAPDPDPVADGIDDAGAGEAARYRRRLRETENERDALVERLTAAHRREVEHLADGMADPGDLWLTGTELADLLDDDGNVDPTKVAAAVETLLAERPHFAKPRPRIAERPRPVRGAPDTTESGATWAEALKDRTKHTRPGSRSRGTWTGDE